MDETLEGRIEALERAVTDGDHDLSALAGGAEALDRLAAAEKRIEELETEVEELDAATQALRGYVGNVRSVNRDVEQRADAALAKAEAVEETVADADGIPDKQAAASEPDGSGVGTQQSETGHDSFGESAPTASAGNTRSAVGTGTGTTDGYTAADGGHHQTGTDHCRACGRPQGDRHDSAGPHSKESFGASRSVSEADDLVESGTEEPGTIERIREML